MKAIKSSEKNRSVCISSGFLGKRGSMTVEACIALPFFLCIIFSIIGLIKLTYTHELMQHAINETVQEMAASSYIYQVCGRKELHDTSQGGINDSTEYIRELVDTLKCLGGDKALPSGAFEDALDFIAGGAFDDIKTGLLAPVSRSIMEKYIYEGSGVGADERLKELHVKDGLKGLDLSSSEFMRDEGESIELVVCYEISLPVPIKIFPDFRIVQRAVARAWMAGDDPSLITGADQETDDIWSLGNLERGKRIRSMFGANLPFNFPVIASFENGKAVMIKSMDLTAESYKIEANICSVLEEYISSLERFKGQETPYGSRKIVIRGCDIKEKQLLLVIPENELKPGVRNLLDNYVAIARSKGIELVIKKHGVKKL